MEEDKVFNLILAIIIALAIMVGVFALLWLPTQDSSYTPKFEYFNHESIERLSDYYGD